MISIKSKSYLDFIEMVRRNIQDVVPDCMNYKFDLSKYKPRKIGFLHPCKKFNENDLKIIFQMKKNGFSTKDIAKLFKVGVSCIRRILIGKTYNCFDSDEKCLIHLTERIITSTNKSGVVGVHFDKKLQKYKASIHCNYKQIHLGTFNSFEEAVEAVEARKSAEKIYLSQRTVKKRK